MRSLLAFLCAIPNGISCERKLVYFDVKSIDCVSTHLHNLASSRFCTTSCNSVSVSSLSCNLSLAVYFIELGLAELCDEILLLAALE
eukprot:m.10886 g.10886  ORF g.10886 m.10886 type:complete len:87 (+) comp8003_c0_seq2:485-745(+)